MSNAMELAQFIKDAVSALVFNKTIDRPTLIEALEEAAADIEGVIDALKDDQRREDER